MREPHRFWQGFETVAALTPPEGGWREGYPARLPDGRTLLLPIRPLAGTEANGIASLIINQASLSVHDAMAEALADQARPLSLDVVAALPTLGLTLGMETARRLGHDRFVPCGTSRKFWYEDRLSEPMRSITSPGQGKTLYLDPRILPLLQGRRVLLVDDVLSTGSSILAGLRLMRTAGIVPAAIGCAMLQTERWAAALRHEAPWFEGTVLGVIRSPLLVRRGEGWFPA